MAETTLGVRQRTLEKFNEMKPYETVSADEFLQELLNEWRADGREHPNTAPDSEPFGCLDGQPIVEVDRVEIDGQPQAVIGKCPICGQSHRHGFDEGISTISAYKSSLSHRAAHCGTISRPQFAPGGYWLIYTDDTKNVEYDDSEGGYVTSPP